MASLMVRHTWPTARCFQVRALPFAVCLWSACAGGDSQLSTMGMGGSSAPTVTTPDRVHVRFDPGDSTPMMLGATPWPDDLYLDKAGRIAISTFKDVGAEAEQSKLMRDSLAELDGFGVSSPIYFYLDGVIDPASLPQAVVDSIDAQASVFLIDADTGSPDAFTKVPVVVQWNAKKRRLALRPADGHPLTPGRRYAAVVTRGVKDPRGQDLLAAPKFAAVLDPEQTLADARLLVARAEYTPVIETLIKTGIRRQDISGLAVFHVQTVERDLTDARRLVRAGKSPMPTVVETYDALGLASALGTSPTAPIGLDEAGGVAHEHLAAMLHGNLPSPNLLSATANAHGTFERDETGELRVKRTEAVPFTLFVPMTAIRVPIVIYQHQRDRDRGDALALANELASRGLAVLALDAPFQGLRANPPAGRTSVDWRNRFTAEEMPDRFGEAPGDFLGLEAAAAAGVRWNPLHARDALRQGVVDLMVAMRVIEEGGFNGVLGRTFVASAIGFVGEDVGATMGVLLARFEPAIQALVLVSPASGSLAQWSSSANDKSLFASFASSFGYKADALDSAEDPRSFWPESALYQTLLDRADALAHVSALRRAAVNVLVLMAEDDESVSNPATEAYAAALGITLLGSQPRYVSALRSEELAAGGIRGNYAASGSWVTRAMYVYSPATHDFLLHRTGTKRYVHPPDPPFETLSQPEKVQNATGAATRQIASYLESFYACLDSDTVLPNTACTGSLAPP